MSKKSWKSRNALDGLLMIGGVGAVCAFLASWISGTVLNQAGAALLVVAGLLLIRKAESLILARMASPVSFRLHRETNETLVLRDGAWVCVKLDEVRSGERIKVLAGMTVPFDGILEDDGCELNEHLLTGKGEPLSLVRGSPATAGAIASADFELTVQAGVGERRIDGWARRASERARERNSFSAGLEKAEKILVLVGLFGAFGTAFAAALLGESILGVVDAFFLGFLGFSPLLFTSVLSLSKKMAALALYRVGVLTSDTEALFRLRKAENFYFDKTGTLEAVDSRFEPFTQLSLVEHLLSDLALINSHPVLRGLKTLPAGDAVNVVEEIPAKGVRALTKEGGELIVGRPSYLRSRGIDLPVQSGNLFPLVAYNGEVIGQIITKKTYDRRSKAFLKNLLRWNDRIRIEILSGDPDPEAGRFLRDISSRIRYSGGLTPEEKAERVHHRSVFVGDGLNDALALKEADVSFLMGHRVSGFLPADFHVHLPNINLILATMSYAAVYRKIVIQTLVLGFLYNVLVLLSAVAGFLSAATAVFALVLTYLLLLLNSKRLLKSPEVPR